MIRFKILSAGSNALLGFAKSQVRRIIEGGVDEFVRNWVVSGVTITARCMRLMGDHIVKLTMSGQVTLYSALYPMTSTQAASSRPFSTDDYGYLLTLNNDNINYPNRPVSVDANMAVSGLTFSDGGTPDFSPNVTAVNSTRLYARCDVSYLRETLSSGHVYGIKNVDNLVSREVISKLYEDRHGSILASLCNTNFITRPPAGLGLFNEVTQLIWTPFYFFKENGDVYALCHCTPGLADSNSGGLGTPLDPYHVTNSMNMPYTGQYDMDRFSTQELYYNAPARFDDSAVGIVPPLVTSQYGLILMKAKVYDLQTKGGFTDPRTVNATLGSGFTFSYLGHTHTFPINPPRAHDEWLLLPPATQATVPEPSLLQISNSHQQIDDGVYRLIYFYEGIITEDGKFQGTVNFVVYTVYRTGWDTPQQKTFIEAGSPPVSSNYHFPSTYDYKSTSKTERTSGLYAPLDNCEYIDLRAFVWPAHPTYLRPNHGADVFELLPYTDSFGDLKYNSGFVDCRIYIWSYFSGIRFNMAWNRSAVHVQTGPGISSVSYQQLIESRYGQYSSGLDFAAASANFISYDQISNQFPTGVNRNFNQPLILNSQGQRYTLGTFNDDFPGPSIQHTITYVPSGQFSALGLTEFSAAQGGFDSTPGYYFANVHPRTGYVEKFPAYTTWEFNVGNPLLGSMGRMYNGTVVLEAEDLSHSTPSDNGRPLIIFGDEEWVNSIPFVGDQFHIDWYCNPSTAFESQSNFHGDQTTFAIRMSEYPYAFKFYPDADKGGNIISIPFAQARASLPMASIYYPNLRDGQDGFALLRVGPAAAWARLIYFLREYTVLGLPLLNGDINTLASFITQPIFLNFPVYATNITLFKTKCNDMYARRGQQPPPISSGPTSQEFKDLKVLALQMVRSSYEVYVNNFAPPELMDIIVGNMVVIPYRS